MRANQQQPLIIEENREEGKKKEKKVEFGRLLPVSDRALCPNKGRESGKKRPLVFPPPSRNLQEERRAGKGQMGERFLLEAV